MSGNVYVVTGISAFFILLGLVLPFIEADLNLENSNTDIDQLKEDLESNAENSVTLLSLIGSILKMFFWSFGSIPFWLDITLFLIARIYLLLSIIDIIWIG